MTPAITQIFATYPLAIRRPLKMLRQMILDTAAESESGDKLTETLKWGQPSYITCRGSTIRLGAVKSESEKYAMFFNCQTSLIETFREIYGDRFCFDGKRAILFATNIAPDEKALKHCIFLALNYHDRKNLPLLGA